MPELRFPEFRRNGEWAERPLGNMSTRIRKKVGTKVLTPVSITAGLGFVDQTVKFGRRIAGEQYKNYIHIKRGDFVYNKGNSKTFAQGCIYQLKEFDEAAASTAFICFKLDDRCVDQYFQSLFEFNAHGRELAKFITSGARSDGLLNINPNAFFSIELPVPPSKAEQQKIADCLGSLDELIAAHSRKLDALQDHKKGLLQNLFPAEKDSGSEKGEVRSEKTPKLRFPEFEGEWVEMELEKLAKRGSGHTPNKSYPEYYNGGIKWVSLADSKRLDRGLISETKIQISELGIANSSATLHSAGCVILSRDAGVGMSAVLAEPMAVSQHFIVWHCYEEKLSNWFLYYLMQQSKPIFENMATGSTIKTIGLPFFKTMRINIPTLPEQQKIADCLSDLDALITAQTEQIAALKAHKKGLMQKLFPNPNTQPIST